MTDRTPTELRIRANIALTALADLQREDINTLPDIDLHRFIAATGRLHLQAEDLLMKRGYGKILSPDAIEAARDPIALGRPELTVIDGHTRSGPTRPSAEQETNVVSFRRGPPA